jgi:hypothetical protein
MPPGTRRSHSTTFSTSCRPPPSSTGNTRIYEKKNDLKVFVDYPAENGSSQGQNLALTGLRVPSSCDTAFALDFLLNIMPAAAIQHRHHPAPRVVIQGVWHTSDSQGLGF